MRVYIRIEIFTCFINIGYSPILATKFFNISANFLTSNYRVSGCEREGRTPPVTLSQITMIYFFHFHFGTGKYSIFIIVEYHWI